MKRSALLIINIFLAAGLLGQRFILIGSIKDDMVLKAKFGTSVYFKFNNVNPLYAQSIIITATPFNFAGDVPSIFSTPEKIEPADNTSETGFADNRDGRLALQKKLQKEFIVQYAIFKKSLDNLSAAAQLENYIIQQLKKEGSFVQDTSVIKQNLRSYFKSINNGSDDADKFRQSIFQKLDSVNAAYLQLSFIYDALSKTLSADTLTFKGKLEGSEPNSALNVKNLNVIVERKKFFSEEFAFAKQRITFINKDSTRNALISTINSGADLYKKIQAHSFSKTEGPFFISDDQVTFKPQLKNDKNEVVKEFEIPVRACGGVKVDFSAGYLLSFRGDEEYSTVFDSTGKATGIRQTQKENLTHALGAMINVYHRSAGGISYGGSFGISIPTDGKLNFYLGASLLALEKNRLVVTAGVSWLKLKLLNQSNVDVKDNKYVFTGSVKEPQYDSRYRPAFFLGLTYNIFTLSPQTKK